MLKIDNKVRDEIVQWLRSQIVHAEVGAGMIQIVNILNRLEKIEEKKEEEVEEEEKINNTNENNS